MGGGGLCIEFNKNTFTYASRWAHLWDVYQLDFAGVVDCRTQTLLLTERMMFKNKHNTKKVNIQKEDPFGNIFFDNCETLFKLIIHIPKNLEIDEILSHGPEKARDEWANGPAAVLSVNPPSQ